MSVNAQYKINVMLGMEQALGDTEATVSPEVQSQPGLQNEFKARVSYLVRLCLKRKRKWGCVSGDMILA